VSLCSVFSTTFRDSTLERDIHSVKTHEYESKQKEINVIHIDQKSKTKKYIEMTGCVAYEEVTNTASCKDTRKENDNAEVYETV